MFELTCIFFQQSLKVRAPTISGQIQNFNAPDIFDRRDYVLLGVYYGQIYQYLDIFLHRI